MTELPPSPLWSRLDSEIRRARVSEELRSSALAAAQELRAVFGDDFLADGGPHPFRALFVGASPFKVTAVTALSAAIADVAGADGLPELLRDFAVHTKTLERVAVLRAGAGLARAGYAVAFDVPLPDGPAGSLPKQPDIRLIEPDSAAVVFVEHSILGLREGNADLVAAVSHVSALVGGVQSEMEVRGMPTAEEVHELCAAVARVRAGAVTERIELPSVHGILAPLRVTAPEISRGGGSVRGVPLPKPQWVGLLRKVRHEQQQLGDHPGILVLDEEDCLTSFEGKNLIQALAGALAPFPNVLGVVHRSGPVEPADPFHREIPLGENLFVVHNWVVGLGETWLAVKNDACTVTDRERHWSRVRAWVRDARW